MGKSKGNKYSSFAKYIKNYDRKAYGEGSDHDPAVDRFSGLDVRKMYRAGFKEYGKSKAEAAQMVLDYANKIKDKSKMGGGTRDALKKLEGFAKGKKDSSSKQVNPQRKKDNPQSLKKARAQFNATALTDPANQMPRVDKYKTNDPSLDAISAGDDRTDWYANKFIPFLNAEANYGIESIGNDTNYFLDKFAYGPPKLGDVSDLFDKYESKINKAAKGKDKK